jgi:uncharacterized protein (UPF0261 family)
MVYRLAPRGGKYRCSDHLTKREGQSMTTVALLGTFDTKQAEYRWLRDQLTQTGCEVLGIDVVTFSDGAGLADIGVAEVARAGGSDLAELRDRGRAMDVLARGAAALVKELHQSGRIDGLLAVGGSSGSSVAAQAMQALPVGVPKLLVSTMASGDLRPFVGDVDVTLMYSVVDIVGVNSVSRMVLGNAAAAISSMAARYERQRNPTEPSARPPVVAATMFGLTTPAVDEARALLVELG